ncbi:MAG TPA: SpoIIE family protein phosphatase [Actinocrinis sp.]|nr:SpoIIE family protein phosphatase [Actinocrinis sp.]
MDGEQGLPRAVLTRAEAGELVAALSGAPASHGHPGAGADGLRALLADYSVTRAILDGAGAGIGVLDPDLRFLYVNDTLAALNGVPADDHIGKSVRDLLPDLDHEPMEVALRSVLDDGRPQLITVTGRTPADSAGEDRWWVNAFHRIEDAEGAVLGVVGIALEVTEAYRVRQLLDRARTRLALLDEAATGIGTTLDVEHTCRELTRLLVPRLADIAAVDVIDASSMSGAVPARGPLRLRRVALTTTPQLGLAAEYFGATDTVIIPQASSAVARCLIEQRPVVSNLPSDPQMAADAPVEGRLERYRSLEMHSAIFVPLSARRDLVGAVILVRAGSSPAFSQEDVDLVADLARRAATSIDNAKRYAREHQTALALQQALLAKPRPPHADVECAARYLPTGSDIEIGGDWYDTVALPGGKTLLAVGDVMGHGFEAAATMSEYRSLLRTLAFQSDRPEVILAEAQRIVDALDIERVATCIVAVVDPGARTCSFANAGHMPPLLLHPDGRRELLDLPIDPPLGVSRDHGYLGATVRFEPGSVLLCYTDGLVERRGEDIEACLARLADVALDPAEPLPCLIDTLLGRFDAAGSEDDVAILAARLLPMPAAAPADGAPPPPDLIKIRISGN